MWRIIPARAGFTDKREWSSSISRDHPRSRGVYRGGFSEEVGGYGSSPLARGLPLRRAFLDESGRIIPARAGFTSTQTMEGAWGNGSSPLARGLHPDHVGAP